MKTSRSLLIWSTLALCGVMVLGAMTWLTRGVLASEKERAIAQEFSPHIQADVVVWNPGPTRAAALADMPDDDWLQLLCVEAAVIGAPVTLAAGQEWVGRQGFVV